MPWFKVAKVSDVPVGTGKMVVVDDRLIALFNVDHMFYAIDDACPHQGAPLSDGQLHGCVTTCPWHGAEFDVTTGKLLSGPGVRDVDAYQVSLEGDDVMVSIKD